MTQAVFFDVGNTLVDLDYATMASIAGPPATQETLENAFGNAWRDLDEYFGDCYANNIDPATLSTILHTLFRHADCALDADAYERLRVANRERTFWRLAKPGARAMLDELRSLGIITAVISNADGKVEDLLRDLGLLEGFTCVIDSGRVGVMKPAKRIFEIALETAGVDAADAAYVGDMPSIDVAGAAAAGLTPILYDPSDVFGSCRALMEVAGRPAHRVKNFAELTNLVRSLRHD